MKKIFWTTAAVICLTTSCTAGTAQNEAAATTVTATDSAARSESAAVPTADEKPAAALPDTLTIAMCGDIMMGTTYPSRQLPPNEGRDLFLDTKAITQRADLAVGNLEGTLCDGGNTTKSPGPNSYSFRMPTSYVANLVDAGYDYVSQANNHANDFGDTGILSTEKVLNEAGIKFSGIAGRTESAIVERNGVKYGICAFGHNRYTIKHRDLDTVRRIIGELRPQCDILVVSFHGGAEGKDKSHLPQGAETFLGEDRGSLREFAHLCIDLGADVVFGHGPHVTRCVEVYKDRFIAYSLGNFCTPYGINVTGISGYAPVVEIKIGAGGEFLKGKIHSFIQQRGVGPRRDTTNSVARQMKMLTESDIQQRTFTIDDEGNIVRK